MLGAGFACSALFFYEFVAGQEEEVEVAPNDVQFDEERGGGAEPVLAQQFAEMGAVFLPDVGVVVFMTGQGAG